MDRFIEAKIKMFRAITRRYENMPFLKKAVFLMTCPRGWTRYFGILKSLMRDDDEGVWARGAVRMWSTANIMMLNGIDTNVQFNVEYIWNNLHIKEKMQYCVVIILYLRIHKFKYDFLQDDRIQELMIKEQEERRRAIYTILKNDLADPIIHYILKYIDWE